MAISLRRALSSSRNLLCTLRAASHHHLSSSISSSHFTSSLSHFTSSLHPPDANTFLDSSDTSFYHFDTRRGFAKGRKQQINEEEEEEEEEDEGEDQEYDDEEKVEVGDVGASMKAAALLQMEVAVDALSRDLTKLRTGRASEGMLDHIMVEYYGIKTPLNRMAAVSVSDPKTLKVTPFDPSALKELEKSIISSPLGLNPKADSQQLIIPIPPLTKEHIQAVCKVVAKSSEDVKQRIRRTRQKALDSIKKAIAKQEREKEKDKKSKDKKSKDKKDKDRDKDKAGSSISEDDVKRLEKEIDDLTKKFVKKAEDMCKTKEKEIRGG